MSREIDVYLGDRIFGGADRRGSTVTFRGDGSAHASHWANYGGGDKGVRVSWDVGRDGHVSGVHGRDQNNNSKL